MSAEKLSSEKASFEEPNRVGREDSHTAGTQVDTAINIEVAYATPQSQLILTTRIPVNYSVEEAIRASGILEEFPEIDLSENKVGIFGKLTKLGSTLQEKDRIEIYRKLIADPKAVRKQRAAEGKKMKKGGGRN
jgi:putative ubiquitin-RnfH superfamily antitoxin RatB of RatAB toxin-antitoxin module